MSSRTALWLCGTALVLGLVGDQLLRGGPEEGAGAALWLVLSIGTALAVARVTKQPDFATLAPLFLTAAFFAACLAWREAPMLKGWDVLATGTALALGLLALRNVRLWSAGLLAYVTGAAGAILRAAVGPILLLGTDLLDSAAGRGPSQRTRALAVGVIVTIPIIIVFGVLLASADPVFERLARFVVVWDFERLLSHLLVIGFLSWVAAGYLRSVVVRSAERSDFVVKVPVPAWGAIEIGVPLGALTVLFLAFVIVQARYLFGGDDLIRTTVGLTYAEYARRGFFELVTVAGLVLPLLLAAELALRPNDHLATRVFRALAAAILVLVGLIIASAAYRLRIYHVAYGWTHDRLYAAAVMVWIASALAWFGATVLRGQGPRFMLGAIVAGFAVVAAMNVLNPDAVIARTNLARAVRGEELDTSYLLRLSADATGVLAAAVPGLGTADRCAIVRQLAADDRDRREADWRSWSLGRSRADRAFQSISSVLPSCPAAAEEDADSTRAPRL